MKTVCALAATLAVIAGAGEAAAQPAWCNVDGLKDKIGGGNTSMDRVLDKDWNNSLDAIIQGTCWPDAEGTRRKKEVDAARAAWSAKFGMVEADWQDMAEWAANTSAMRLYDIQIEVGGERDAKHALSTLSPVQQLAGILNYIPNATSSTTYVDYLYVADALGPTLSEVGRFGFISRCLRERDSPVALALCEPDIKALDRKKAFEEVRADKKVDAKSRMLTRLMLFEYDARLTEYNAEVKNWKAKDPAYGKLFDIAAQTRREWQDTHWKQETALLDLALAMDDARQTTRRSLLEGCSDKTWAAWKAAVARIPASKFVGFSTEPEDKWVLPAIAVVTSSVPGYLASVALYSCHKREREDDLVVNALGEAMAYTPGLRGPRLAAHWAMLNAGLKLDDASAEISFPGMRHDSSSRFYGQAYGGSMATISKIGKPDAKGTAQLTFARKTEKQERCQKSRMTNRVSQITSNGTVIYWNECLKWGVDVVDRTIDPTTVHTRYLDGVKPGMNVYVSTGVIYAAWPKGKKTPVAVFGVPVK